jgi:hypothetical protein
MLGVAPLPVKTKSGIAACLKQVHRLELRVLKLGHTTCPGSQSIEYIAVVGQFPMKSFDREPCGN